ncbi:MAG: M4 family metallopeptidase, partial [Saprospiraceae bacterium]|nr:M4 family metallopeptidase [Saprospiraceae bacterium]
MSKRLSCLLFLLMNSVILVTAQKSTPAINDFIVRTGAQVTMNQATRTPGFIRFPNDRPFVTQSIDAQAVTQSFLTQYSSVLGNSDLVSELRLIETYIDAVGFEHQVYQQYKNDVPVYDGQVKWHYDSAKQLRAINGVFLPFLKISTIPKIAPEQAATAAVDQVKKQESEASLDAHEIELFIYQQGLIQGIAGETYLTYLVTVTSADNAIREFVFVNAENGSIVDQFTGSHSAIHRELYQTNLSNLVWEEGDSQTGLNQWQQNEIEAAGHMYYLFKNTFNFTSYNNADAEMWTIHENPNIDCPNANWNGTTANYCNGTASDDVVAHEWGHAYTEYTNNLIYAWQPGALNESYSDIWGETVDILNGYQDDGENMSLRTACSSSHRWLMGEDASAFGGSIRDMWSPTCKGDPGKMSDPQYYCSSGDNGGVHSNSGVNNHAYALLVDGGTYNGQSINGLGFTKAAHIFWRAQKEYLTITSNFKIQADALEAACNDLMGINLQGLSFTSTPAGPSGETITASDLIQLQKVLLAVEMRLDPPCFFTPLLADSELLCPASAPESAIFYEDFENGLGDWTVTQVPSNPGTWEDREWELTTNLPVGRTSTAAFAPDPINGDCQTDLQNGIIRLESPAIHIPGDITSEITLAFDHWVATEQSWDGGNLKINIDGAGWNLIPASAFTLNDYNLTLKVNSNDNPLAGQPAFTGSDGGSPDGSWGTSVINLSELGVMAGSNIVIRWELGTDGCNGTFGWYVDDISV